MATRTQLLVTVKDDYGTPVYGHSLHFQNAHSFTLLIHTFALATNLLYCRGLFDFQNLDSPGRVFANVSMQGWEKLPQRRQLDRLINRYVTGLATDNQYDRGGHLPKGISKIQTMREVIDYSDNDGGYVHLILHSYHCFIDSNCELEFYGRDGQETTYDEFTGSADEFTGSAEDQWRKSYRDMCDYMDIKFVE